MDETWEADVRRVLGRLGYSAASRDAIIADAREGAPPALDAEEERTAVLVSDGCTWSPDSFGAARFKQTCDDHDTCYTSGQDRYACDLTFLAGLILDCREAYGRESLTAWSCAAAAATYFGAVRAVGSHFYHGSGRNN